MRKQSARALSSEQIAWIVEKSPVGEKSYKPYRVVDTRDEGRDFVKNKTQTKYRFRVAKYSKMDATSDVSI